MNKSAVKAMSGERIEEFVEEFRRIFGIEEVDNLPVLKFLEWFLFKIDIQMEIVYDYELPDAYAVADTKTGVIKIREDVYDMVYHDNPRHRFTVCHEIGHAILHTPDRVQFARGDVPTYMNSEWQANRFAAALLAPRNLAMGLTEQQMVEKFGISREAAHIRYETLHKK